VSASLRLSRVALLALCASATACEWFTDFKRQPSVVTWESLRQDSAVVRGAPSGSVPTTGTFMPAYAVSYSQMPGTIDSLAAIANPTPVTEQSLAHGRLLYEINCAPCHGETAAGDGPATKWGMVPISLQTDIAKNQRTDGYIFGMIRNGRGLMPSYNRIEEMDRWDVVNYVRALQGKVTGVNFATGQVAPPGVTGDALPGANRLGPNRWVAPVLPALSPTVGAGTSANPGAGGGATPPPTNAAPDAAPAQPGADSAGRDTTAKKGGAE
jgi:mono/diheme cytochrome c family protein